MRDPLKQFMETNRAAFDEQEPPKFGWENLERQLPAKRNPVRLRRLFAAAATVLLLFGLGVFTGIQFTKDSASIVEELPENKEYQEAEAYYSRLVNEKLDELKNYRNEQTSSDIAELEAAFMEWKQELGPSITDEEVMGTMVQHYQRKIEILETTIGKIRTTKKNPTNL